MSNKMLPKNKKKGNQPKGGGHKPPKEKAPISPDNQPMTVS